MLEKARSLFADVRDRAPDRQDALLGLALSTYRLGDAALAATYYNQVLNIDPYNRQAMNDLAWILAVELDQPTEAIRIANRAVVRYPNDATILDTRGVVFMMVGRLTDARADLERCISLENEPSLTKTAALVHLGEVLVQLNEVGEARTRLLEARALDRKHPTLDDKTQSRLEELIRSLP